MRQGFEDDGICLFNDRFESVDLPISAVGDNSDSDDGNNGDFEEVELFIQVARRRSSNSSR